MLNDTATVSFRLNGKASLQVAQVVFIEGLADTDQSVISANTARLSVDSAGAALITVQLKDANGNLLLTGGESVSIIPSKGAVGVVSDNGDGTYSAQFNSLTAAGNVQFSFRINGGSPSVNTCYVTMVAGAASVSRSVVASAPKSIIADGVSTSRIYVILKDNYGNSVGKGGDTVQLVSDLGSLSALTDHNNGSYTAFLTSSTTVGTATLSFLVNGTPSLNTDTVAFIDTTPVTVTSTLSVLNDTLLADGTSQTTVKIDAKDASGSPVTTGGRLMTILTNAGTLSAITDHNDGTYTATLTSSIKSGIASLRFTEDGMLSPQTNIKVYFVSGAADASQSTIAVSNRAILANGFSSSMVTVTLRDKFGNKLSKGNDNVALFTTAGSLNAFSDHSNGTYTATLQSTNSIDTAHITFAVNTRAADATTSVLFSAGLPSADTSTITAQDEVLLADGIASTTITIQLRDQFGNTIAVGNNSVKINATIGTLGATQVLADGRCVATLTSQVRTGRSTVSFSVNGSATSKNSCSVNFIAGAPDFDNAEISASPTSIMANGTAQSLISIQLKDVYGNNYPATTENIEIYTSLGSLGAVSKLTNGKYQAQFTAPTAAGLSQFGLMVNGDTTLAKGELMLNAGLPQAENSLIIADTTFLIADSLATLPFTIYLRDAYGNRVATGDNNISAYVNNIYYENLVDHGDGTYSGELTSLTQARTTHIKFSVNGGLQAENIAELEVAPAKADKTTSIIQAAQTLLIADGTSNTEIRLQLKDVYDNVYKTGGDSVVMYTTHGNISAVVDNEDGTYTAILNSTTKIGTADVTFSVNGTSDVSNKATVQFMSGLPAPDASDIRVTPAHITADGVSEGVVVITLKDVNGNLVTKAGQSVAYYTTKGQLSTLVDNGDGTFTGALRSETKSDSALVSFSVNNSTVSINIATAWFVAGEPVANHSTITVSDTVVVADGIEYATVQIQLADTRSNLLRRGGDSVTFKTTLGEFFDFSDNKNGTYSAKIRSYKELGSALITFEVNGGASDQTERIAFVKAIADANTSEIYADTTVLVADGLSQTLITVRLNNLDLVPLIDGGDVVNITTTQGTLSAVTDHYNGTYTATLTSDTVSGMAKVGFSVNSNVSNRYVEVDFIAGECAVIHSTIKTAKNSIPADGTSSSVISVTLSDKYNNRLNRGGEVVNITSDKGTISHVTDNGNGTYEAVLTSDTVVAVATVSFCVDGLISNKNVAVRFIAGRAAAIHSTISLSDSVALADGTSAVSINIKVADAFGNRITMGGDAVVITTTYGVLTPVLDHNDGTYSGEITADYYGKALIGFKVNGTASATFLELRFLPTDKDADGLADDVEDHLGTDPYHPDSDLDGVTDFTEVQDDTNPLDYCELIVEHQTEATGTQYWNSMDCDDDGVFNVFEKFDSDGDSIPGYLDDNDDNDALLTIDEMPDPNGDGNPDDAYDSDNDGLPDYLDTNVVTIGLEDGVEVYNTITPNNDGLNDVFTVRNIDKYADNRLIVVNRLGDVVYNDRNITSYKTFEGKVKGGNKLLPAGIYFYQLTYNNESGEKRRREGFIFLNY